MQDIYSEINQIFEKLETKDSTKISEAIDLLNTIFQHNYPLDEGYIIYKELAKIVPLLVDILMTSEDTQILGSIKSLSNSFTEFPEMYEALVDVFQRNIGLSSISLDAGRYLTYFYNRLIDTQVHYLEALQSPLEYMRLIALKLLSEFEDNRMKNSIPNKITPKKKIQESTQISLELDTKSILTTETLLQIFLDVTTTDKSQQIRNTAWRYAGEQNRIENVDYILEYVLRSIIYDILVQFQPGVKVQLLQIIDMISSKPINRLKELIDSIDESNVKLSGEKVVTAIQELIDQKIIDGSYSKRNQVFVLRNIDDQQVKPRSFRIEFLCLKCASKLNLDDNVCSHCKTKINSCIICKRPISFGEEATSCPKCKNQAHFAHLKEWIKAKGKCPICSAKLNENDITAH